MRAHAQLARSCGVNRALTGLNGDLFMIAPVPGIRRAATPAARLGVGESSLEPLPAPDYAAEAEAHPEERLAGI